MRLRTGPAATLSWLSSHLSRPSWAAAPPGMTLVMKMLGSSPMCGLSVPPAMLKPSPELPWTTKTVTMTTTTKTNNRWAITFSINTSHRTIPNCWTFIGSEHKRQWRMFLCSGFMWPDRRFYFGVLLIVVELLSLTLHFLQDFTLKVTGREGAEKCLCNTEENKSAQRQREGEIYVFCHYRKTQTNNMLVRLSAPTDFLSAAHWFRLKTKILETREN